MYQEALLYLESLKSAGIHPGLDTVRALCAALGNPQDRLQIIHAAGTNGKGSTCAYCGGILQAAGKRVGVFSSPYVENIREMIRIDGQWVSEALFAQSVLVIKKVCEANRIFPTEFELLTALAFYIFAEQGVEVAVIEAGMGGALDATNVIRTPAVCVLTHIDMDHTSFLGNTLEEIALQKCGIIKKGCKVVAFPNTKVASVLRQYAKEQKAEYVTFTEEDLQNIAVTPNGTEFAYEGQTYKAKMLGVHQAQNALAAILAARALCGPLPHNVIEQGLQATLPARLEVLQTQPLVLLDGAHNPNGASALASTLKAMGLCNLTAVTAAMADKDLNGIMRQIAPYCQKIITTRVPQNARSATAEALCKIAGQYCQNAVAEPNCHIALAKALQEGKNGVLVFGSLYLAEALKNLK